MSWLPRGIWRYGILVVLLLVIAAVASNETISSITDFVEQVESGAQISHGILVRIITIPILALTMGFLFLAGALGVWAIRSTAQIEGRRRIGRFVDAMDYFSDGILALDHMGIVRGMNPAARELLHDGIDPGAILKDAIGCVDDRGMATLLDSTHPEEIECMIRNENGIRALRFRSQPLEDMVLLLVSDVTGKKSEEMRNRQIARLQLIGRIARGVAHDFNNILCAISGHASLLNRRKAIDAADAESLDALLRESQRGAALAGQLLDLSRTGVKGNPCENLESRIEEAVNLLKVALSAEWQVIADVKDTHGRIGLTDAQIEQVVVNLGLLVADELSVPGFVHVRILPPGQEPLTQVGNDFVAVGLISAYGPEPDAMEKQYRAETQTTAGEAGVIQSVVRSMLEEVGGRLDIMVASGGKHSYRVCFPRLVDSDDKMSALANVSEELKMKVGSWKLLLAVPASKARAQLEEYLEELGISVEVAGDIVMALQHVEAGRALSVMVIDRGLLGEEADALLKAIRKLRPHVGLVVLCESPESIPDELKKTAVFESEDISPETMLHALIQAVDMMDT